MTFMYKHIDTRNFSIYYVEEIYYHKELIEIVHIQNYEKMSTKIWVKDIYSFTVK